MITESLPVLQPNNAPSGDSASWVDHTLRAWRTIAGLREELRDTGEVLHTAVQILHEQRLELDRLRERYQRLLDERERHPQRAA